MFERFTDRSRRVVVLAQEQARLLNHNYIGTEHLLLALFEPETDAAGVDVGVAAGVLAGQNLRRDVLRALITPGATPTPPGHLPFTPRAKRVLEYALREALQLGHNYIGTEHLLLALVREAEAPPRPGEREGQVTRLLRECAVKPATIRRAVLEALSGGKTPIPPRPPAVTEEYSADAAAIADWLTELSRQGLTHTSPHAVISAIRRGDWRP